MIELLEGTAAPRSGNVTKSNLNLRLEDSPSLLDAHGPLFILGCPRSGTTVLSDCIGNLENVEAFIGVLAPPRKMHWIGQAASQGEDVTQLMWVVRDIFWQSFWRRRHALQERLVQILKGRKSVLTLFNGKSLNGLIFSYKEPFMCFAVEQFAQHFPNAKFIHIVRDGRDNADSIERTYPRALSNRILTDELLANNNNSEIGVFRKHKGFCVPWWVPEDETDQFISLPAYGRFMLMWREAVRRVIDCGATLPPERFLQVKYEDLVTYPAENSDRLANFIGSAKSAGFKRRMNELKKTSIGIAKRNQSPETLDAATAIAGDLLAKLGYAR